MLKSDAELMAALCRDTPAAIDPLVERYRPRLFRFAIQTFGDASLADDLVQETFAAVYAARDTFNPQFAFSTWIWTILLNLCRRHRRGDRSRTRMATKWAALPGRQTVPESPLEGLVRDEESARLRAQLDTLPPAQADALRLRFLAGLSFEEIAATMNSSVSGAKVRVRKGLDALSRSLTSPVETDISGRNGNE